MAIDLKKRIYPILNAFECTPEKADETSFLPIDKQISSMV